MAIATFQLFLRASASAAVIAFVASSRVMYFIVPGMMISLFQTFVQTLQMESPIWYSDYMALEIGPIRHVGLFTPDLDAHVRFYCDVWGLEPATATKDAVYLRGLSAESFILSLHRSAGRGLH